MKTIIILATIATALLAGCGESPTDYKSEPIVMTVRGHSDASSKWSCIGTDVKTLLKSEDGRSDLRCGDWGKEGEKVAGCWETGHRGEWANSNGFHNICTK